MIVIHLIISKPLCLCSPYIILPDNFKHLRPDISGEYCNACSRLKDGRQYEVPQLIHRCKREADTLPSKCPHAEDRDIEYLYHKYNHYIGEKESGERYKGIREKCCPSVKCKTSFDCSMYPDRKCQTPCKYCPNNKEHEAIVKPLCYLPHDRLVVFK